VKIIVIAKEPWPGRSKTRLCPPLTFEEAAGVAEAALADTLSAVAASGASERVLALEGSVGWWLPTGFRVIAQRGRGLDERIAAAFEDAGGPAILIGMDTPQVTPGVLDACLDELREPGVDIVLGPACDGGWWALGQREPDPAVVVGIPMSSAGTLAAQRDRLDALGLTRRELPRLTDVDMFADMMEVASLSPGSRFSEKVAGLRTGVPV
jgi:hypothetical protein